MNVKKWYTTVKLLTRGIQYVCTALLCYRTENIKEALNASIYIHINVYLYEVFVYRHFKAII